MVFSIRDVIQTFERRHVIYDPEKGADARELSGLQPSLWQTLVMNLPTQLNAEPNVRSALHRFFEQLLEEIKHSPLPTVQQVADGTWTVHGNYPILDPKFVSEAVKYDDLLIGGVIVEMCCAFAISGKSTGVFNDVVTHPLFSLFCMKYMTLKEAERSTTTVEAILKDMREQAGSVQGAAQLSYHEAKKSIENMKSSVETHISESRSELEQNIASLSDEISKLEEEIPRIKQLAHESAALNSSKKIWENRISKYKTTHWVWLGLITFVIIVFVCLTVAYGGDYIKKFPIKADGDYAYAVILFSIIPVIAIAWILKFFGRIVSNSLVLKEDAELRDAMLNTYFALIGDPEAKFDSKERILIINAIFRPLPGHQSEDVAPPTLADLAKDQLGMGKDKS